MPRKISRKGLVRKLDKVFSMFIRTRLAKEEQVQCVTCGTVRKHYKEVDAGHFVSRRHYATRWNCHKTYTFNVKAVMAFTEVKTT
jgi:hypothetical protein